MAKSQITVFSSFTLTCLGAFLSLRYVYIFKISKTFSIFFMPYMTYFKRIKISPLRRGMFYIFGHKNQVCWKNALHYKNLPFLILLDFLFTSKNVWNLVLFFKCKIYWCLLLYIYRYLSMYLNTGPFLQGRRSKSRRERVC